MGRFNVLWVHFHGPTAGRPPHPHPERKAIGGLCRPPDRGEERRGEGLSGLDGLPEGLRDYPRGAIGARRSYPPLNPFLPPPPYTPLIPPTLHTVC